MNETNTALISYGDEVDSKTRPAWQIELYHAGLAEASAWRVAEDLRKAARKKARKVAQASRRESRKAR